MSVPFLPPQGLGVPGHLPMCPLLVLLTSPSLLLVPLILYPWRISIQVALYLGTLSFTLFLSVISSELLLASLLPYSAHPNA